MKATAIHEYGGPEVLRYEDIARPEPGPGQALIRVHAAAINPVDWKIRAGYLKDYFKFELPMIPGVDFSGTVDALGAGANGVAVGAEVYGQSDFTQRFGTYAQYVTIDATKLSRKPKSIDHVHAAAVAGAAAWHSFFGEGMVDLQQARLS